MNGDLDNSLANLFPGIPLDKIEIIDLNNWKNNSVRARFSILKIELFAQTADTISYDCLIPGYYKILEIAEIEPDGEYDKHKRYLARINWKEFPDDKYDETFSEQIRINPLLYQVNADLFVFNVKGEKVIFNGYGSPALCIDNFQLLLGREIFVGKVSQTLNTKGQTVYKILWEFL
jgi:hypothetical protein